MVEQGAGNEKYHIQKGSQNEFSSVYCNELRNIDFTDGEMADRLEVALCQMEYYEYSEKAFSKIENFLNRIIDSEVKLAIFPEFSFSKVGLHRLNQLEKMVNEQKDLTVIYGRREPLFNLHHYVYYKCKFKDQWDDIVNDFQELEISDDFKERISKRYDELLYELTCLAYKEIRVELLKEELKKEKSSKKEGLEKELNVNIKIVEHIREKINDIIEHSDKFKDLENTSLNKLKEFCNKFMDKKLHYNNTVFLKDGNRQMVNKNTLTANEYDINIVPGAEWGVLQTNFTNIFQAVCSEFLDERQEYTGENSLIRKYIKLLNDESFDSTKMTSRDSYWREPANQFERLDELNMKRVYDRLHRVGKPCGVPVISVISYQISTPNVFHKLLVKMLDEPLGLSIAFYTNISGDGKLGGLGESSIYFRDDAIADNSNLKKRLDNLQPFANLDVVEPCYATYSSGETEGLEYRKYNSSIKNVWQIMIKREKDEEGANTKVEGVLVASLKKVDGVIKVEDVTFEKVKEESGEN